MNIIKKFINANNKTKKITRRLFKPIINLVFYDLISKYKPLKKFVILQTPEHNNIGDHAIALATKTWVKDYFPQYAILEFSYKDIIFRFDAIKRIINNDDIIILQGGGNFGDLYLYEEKARRKVIKHLINNKIIIMPQSINYSDTKLGKQQLNKTNKILKLHKNITIYCRDEISYLFAKQQFYYNKIKLSPDIVHYLQGDINYDKENYILLSFRNDKECVTNSDFKKEIESFLNSKNIKYICQDTVIKRNVFDITREKEVTEILKTFAKARMVITDRFHGMVFSVITNTPCIVFKSLDHKISSGIKWYETCNKIKYIDSNDFDLFKKTLSELIQLNNDESYINIKDELIKIFNSDML